MIIGSSQGNLGDNVLITPIFKAIPYCHVRMYDSPTCRNVAPLFHGLVDSVEFCDTPGTPPTVDEPTHKSQRMLNALGLTEVSCIPRVLVTPGELAWARLYLSDMGVEVERAMVLVAQNSSWWDPANWLARYICPHPAVSQQLADLARKRGWQVVQFGVEPPQDPTRDNFIPLDNTIQLRGLTVRQTAACYQLIGRMVTCDTGDHCLMLAVGGRISMIVPRENPYYRHYDVQYLPHLWKGEPVRARYHLFDDYLAVADDLMFDW